MDISRFARNNAGLILDVVQGTPEWHALRRGKITGTAVHSLIAGGQGMDTVVKNLLIDRVSSSAGSDYKSAAMERGNLLEDEARKIFEIYLFDERKVLEVGAIIHPKIKNFMISPDGLYSEYGLIEIKCLEAKNYIDHYIEYKKNPSGFKFLEPKYNTQVQAGLSCSKNDHAVGIIYNPDFSGNEYIEFYIEPDLAFIGMIEDKVSEAEFMANEYFKRYFS